MRIMITGATTHLGKRLIQLLMDDPEVEQILALGAPDTKLGLLEAHEKVLFQHIDLTRSRDLRRLIYGVAQKLEINTVIHLAFHRRSHDPKNSQKLNVEASRDLLTLCENHPTIKHFVFRSYGEIFDFDPHFPAIITETHPLNLGAKSSAWLRERVAADLMVCARMGMVPLKITVLRPAECLAEDVGSQLYEYLRLPFCLKPLGFDPMINLVSCADLAWALFLSVKKQKQGVFNIPGTDILPLSQVIKKSGKSLIPIPGKIMGAIYKRISKMTGNDFEYSINRDRFHFSGVLDGGRAKAELGYEPMSPIHWISA